MYIRQTNDAVLYFFQSLCNSPLGLEPHFRAVHSKAAAGTLPVCCLEAAYLSFPDPAPKTPTGSSMGCNSVCIGFHAYLRVCDGKVLHMCTCVCVRWGRGRNVGCARVHVLGHKRGYACAYMMHACVSSVPLREQRRIQGKRKRGAAKGYVYGNSKCVRARKLVMSYLFSQT